MDLRRAVEESQVKVGDTIALEHRGNQPVTVTVKDYDASGKTVGERQEAVTRNTWYAVNVEQLSREANDRGPATERANKTRPGQRRKLRPRPRP